MVFQNVCYGIVRILAKLREMLSNFQSIGRNVGNFVQEERFKSDMRNWKRSTVVTGNQPSSDKPPPENIRGEKARKEMSHLV